jgi:DNA-binding MarR family transcriptional regulator/GNAT superfamily N-acetyltransferase
VAAPVSKADVNAVRAFNRFYTSTIGVLGEGLLRSPYSLAEARVLFELAQRDGTGLAFLRRSLRLDAGYLSRIVSRFEADGIVTRERSPADARQQVVRLTARGRALFATLDERAAAAVRELLSPLGRPERRQLTAAMGTIERLLARRRAPIRLRSPGPGDFGWVVHRHGAVYAREYGWDASFEALVARIVAEYVDAHDPEREAAWIAELGGEPVGCVFCMEKDKRVAQLRLLLVERHARGLGIGGRLVDECIAFARRRGYEQVVLWTNDVLHAARRLYEHAGFELVAAEPHRSFGHALVGQTWRKSL